VVEAFTMPVMDASADVAPYPHRQIIPLMRDQWADRLDSSDPPGQLQRWLPNPLGRQPGSTHVPSKRIGYPHNLKMA